MAEGQPVARSVKALNGYAIGAVDGDMGSVRDAYFDDRRWNVRYLVVDASHWLARRRVLISPRALLEANHAHRVLRTALTRDEVANSPDIDTEKPVSRQHEAELYRRYLPQYYLPYYWVTSEDAGSPCAVTGVVTTFDVEAETDLRGHDDPHLRSAHALMHHYVHAIDGDIGHVADFLCDASWKISHLVVATGTFRPGRKVLVPVRWITWISRDAGTIDVSLTRETIRLAPEYDAAGPVSQEHLARVAAYYATPRTPASPLP